MKMNFKSLLGGICALALFSTVVFATTAAPPGSGGGYTPALNGDGGAPSHVTNFPATSAAPYGLTALVSGSQFGLAPTTATTNQLTVPTAAITGRLCIRVAEVETTEDGSTPTTAPRGTAFPAGTCTWIVGHSALTTLKMISATGTVDVEYFQ